MSLGYHLGFVVFFAEQGFVHSTYAVDHDVCSRCDLEEVVPACGKVGRCTDSVIVEYLERSHAGIEAYVRTTVVGLKYGVAVYLLQRRIHGIHCGLRVFGRCKCSIIGKIGINGLFQLVMACGQTGSHKR